MCGRRYVTRSLSLALLLSLSLPLYSDEAVYEITESELTELETTLTRQAETIETQRETLTRLQSTISEQQTTLTRLSQTIERQATTINELETSFNEYESAARARTIRAYGIGGGIGVAVGIIATLLISR